MFIVPPSKRARHPMRVTGQHRLPPAHIEVLEGRVLFAFNAYIAGVASGVGGESSSFTFSTTGQPAKSWLIHWGDLSPDTPLTAPDPGVGFTTPQIQTHTYVDRGNYAVTADATSITNVTATAVPLGENSSFGNGGGTGKEVQPLADGGSVGTNIASVVDENFNTYVLSVDAKRMAVTRFTPTGQLDTGSGWTSTGTFVLPNFTGVNNQDLPKAMAIDRDPADNTHMLYVAGTSNNAWAVARVDLQSIPTDPAVLTTTLLTGTANALWLDTSDHVRLAVAGTSSAGAVQARCCGRST